MEHNLPHISSTFSIDCIVFGYHEGEVKLLLIERDQPPYQGWWALPGNLVNQEHSLDEGADNILYQLTGLHNIYMDQVYTFGDIDRHPQGRVISVAYYALIKIGGNRPLKPVSKYVRQARWWKLSELPTLAFDHQKIVDKCLYKLKKRINTQPIAFELLPEKFTLTQLQNVYEGILNKKLDKRNFRKKILALNILKPLEEKQRNVAYRAATLYKFDRRRYAKLFAKNVAF